LTKTQYKNHHKQQIETSLIYNIHLYRYGLLSSFFFKNGLLMRYSCMLSQLVFIFYCDSYIKQTVNGFNFTKGFINNVLTAVSLIKPPFVTKTVSVPKKLKRKIGLRYLIKIVYKNESLRFSVALKQIINSCNTVVDNSIKMRLYKSICQINQLGVESHLYKKKLLVFKKFFKI